ncbi:MAG: hypothetical protein ACP6IY_13535, partial [Promethearchaeia archaeon]
MNYRDNFKRYTVRSNLKGKKLLINIPKLCPICGKSKSLVEYKLKADNSYTKYIMVFLCERHNENYKKRFKPSKIGLKIMIIFFIIIISIIISATVFKIAPNIYFELIFIISIFGILGGVVLLIRIIGINHEIHDYLGFKYFKTRSIIKIARSDWARLFSNLNSCEKFIVNTEIYKSLEKKVVVAGILLLSWIFVIAIVSTLNSLNMSPYFKNFFLIGLFGMLILSVFMIYYFLKIEQL